MDRERYFQQTLPEESPKEPERYCQLKLFDGRERIVYKPNKELKRKLRETGLELWRILRQNPDFSFLYLTRVVHGSVPHRNHLTHAKVHMEAGTIVHLDLYHAFEKTRTETIIGSLEHIGTPASLIETVRQKALVNRTLPTGFPSSPVLFCAALIEFDKKLLEIAREHHLKYSRYVDDLTFSTGKEIDFVDQEIVDEIRAAIKSFGYDTHKIRVGHPWSKPFTLCGLSIFEGKVRLPGRTRKRLRGKIHRSLILEPNPKPNVAISCFGQFKTVEGHVPRPLRKYETVAREMLKDKRTNP